MNKKLLLSVMLMLVPVVSAHPGHSVYDAYHRYYNPHHQGFHDSHDFQPEHPRIIYGNEAWQRDVPSANERKLDYYRSQGYYDPDRFTRQGFVRCHYHGLCDEDDGKEHRMEALSVQRGSYEFFKAGHRARSNHEIAFKKGYNDGYYGKKSYFDDRHELTTWYREAYLDGWHAGLEDRHNYDRPG